MCTFLDAAANAALVRRIGLAQTLAAVADNIEQDFLRWQDFDKCARVAAHSPQGVIELMPVADATRYAFKYVNGHPNNHQAGLPTVMAFGVLADVATGLPLLLAEMNLATAIRTAAMSALAARHLARPGSRTMALIGNGAQSEFQALAFHHLLGVQRFHLFDTDRTATAKLCANLELLGLDYACFDSTLDAVRGCDIITTVTADKRNATILTPDMIEPGMHINAVGGDCPGKTELHADILRMGPVFCEFEPQSRIEGELQQMPADFAITEFWRVLAKQAPGRSAPEQVTVFDSVGFALEDYSVLRFLHAQASGTRLDLVPSLDDPKNLFGLLQQQDRAEGDEQEARTARPIAHA